VRHIQEARKEADYQVDDRISVEISGANEVVEKFTQNIESETLSKITQNIESADVEKNIQMDDLEVKILLKK